MASAQLKLRTLFQVRLFDNRVWRRSDRASGSRGQTQRHSRPVRDSRVWCSVAVQPESRNLSAESLSLLKATLYAYRASSRLLTWTLDRHEEEEEEEKFKTFTGQSRCTLPHSFIILSSTGLICYMPHLLMHALISTSANCLSPTICKAICTSADEGRYSRCAASLFAMEIDEL